MLLRPTWAEIDLQAIAHNLKEIKKKLKKNTRILAIVKADAYGHGAIEVARICQRHDTYLGVALIEEAIVLREAGIKAPILILGSIFPFENFEYVLKYDLIPTIASFAGARALSMVASKYKKEIKFHLKIDTGMGRIGLNVLNAPDVIRKVLSLPFIKMDGIYTHLTSADSDDNYTREQIEKFARIVKELAKEKISITFAHVAGSAAILKYKNAEFNMVRPGLLLYGLAPFEGAQKYIKLKPALSLKTRIVYLKRVSKGNSISYGRTFITKRNSFIATLPIGYADGYRWLLSNKSQVLIKGRRFPVVGRICMDMCMADFTGIKGIDVGEEVVLLGRQGRESITAAQIAELAKTITYEIVCGISTRVPRVYKG